LSPIYETPKTKYVNDRVDGSADHYEYPEVEGASESGQRCVLIKMQLNQYIHFHTVQRLKEDRRGHFYGESLLAVYIVRIRDTMAVGPILPEYGCPPGNRKGRSSASKISLQIVERLLNRSCSSKN
jgi:hypothetical protein